MIIFVITRTPHSFYLLYLYRKCVKLSKLKVKSFRIGKKIKSEMRDSAKLKGKCKYTNSPSKMHLSTSMSSDNDVAEATEDNVDEVVIKMESTSTKTNVDKNGRQRFWPFGGSDSDKKSDVRKSDRKKSKKSESSDKSSKPSGGSVRRATLEPSASPAVSATTPRATRSEKNNFLMSLSSLYIMLKNKL
jgi:hypothetical protein